MEGKGARYNLKTAWILNLAEQNMERVEVRARLKRPGLDGKKPVSLSQQR